MAFCSPLQRRSRPVLLLVWCASSVVRVMVSQRGRAASLASLLVALCFRCSVVFAWRFAVLCSVVLGLFCFWFGAPLLLLGCWCCSVVELPASPLFLWRCAFVALWFCLAFCSPLQRRSRLVLLLVWCASSVVRVMVSQRGRAASLASLLVALCFRCSVVLLGVLQSFAASFSACFASGLVRLFCC